MNSPSSFQLQYPLSPRKFWKKMIGSFGSSGIWLLIPIVLAIIINGKLMEFGASSQLSTFSIIILFLIGLSVVWNIVYVFYIKAYIKRYYYDCGEQFITIKKGVFAPTEIHVQYQKIQDVYVDQDILDRIMGLYDVHIASATVTSGIEAHIDGVDAKVAEDLKNIILGKINGSSNPYLPTPGAPLQPHSQPNPISFSQKISSETYPISGSWIWSMLLSTIGGSVFGVFFLSQLFLELSDKHNFDVVAPMIFLFVALFIGQIVYKVMWKNNYYFEFTPDYILLRTGVLARSENHLPYKSIQNILNKQGVSDRVFGLSTIKIENAAQLVAPIKSGSMSMNSGISLVWQPKEKAEELNKVLNDIVSKINPQSQGNNMGV